MQKSTPAQKSGLEQILKHIQNERPLTTFEVSRICGVVHTTVTNWIEAGRLNAYRTPGGHRRIRQEDLLVFLKLYDIPIPKEFGPEFTRLLAAAPPLEPEGGGGEKEEPQKPVHNGGKKILIVEDDLALSGTLAELLKEAYPEVKITQAFDGFEAGKDVALLPPDLIILDLILPGVDGFRIIRSVRQDERSSAAKIIVITGHNTPAHQAQIEEAGGADGFFPKPVDLSALREKVGRLLKLKAGRKP